MGVIPVNMQSASLDVVRNAFAIRMLMRRCTRKYFCLLCSKFIVSIHTGAPYVSRGRIAPSYIFAMASYLIPHVVCVFVWCVSVCVFLVCVCVCVVCV